jgi:hypothetical protein
MKGKIDKRGELFIERGGALLRMSCPFSDYLISPIPGHPPESQEPRICGHWCAMFGEPRKIIINPKTGKKSMILELCHKSIVFDEFTDER